VIGPAPGPGEGGQSVAGSVVLGDVVQIRDVGGNVSVRLARPVYRAGEFPAVREAVPAAVARAQPSRLLLARYELVPFAGRAGLLGELAGWLAEPGPGSVRLIYGPGGQGKSRLAAYVARHQAAGWAVWQARQAGPVAQAAAPAVVPAQAAGLLVVVDYADRWPSAYLLALVSDLQAAAARLAGPPRLRVLLLARAAGFWWDAVQQRLDADCGLPAAAGRLEPLGAEEDRAGLYGTAVAHFAAALEASAAGLAAALPRGLAGPEFGLVLTVHMAALAAVDAARRGEAAPQDPARISAYLLKRERAHWQQWHARAEDPLATTAPVMSRAVYAATLAGPLPRAQAVTLLARAQIADASETAAQVLDDHGRCYPPGDPATVLEPLYPDRLGEDFLALATPGPAGPEGDLAGFADAWAADVLPALLAPAAAGQPPAAWARPAITVLIETARRWPHIRDRQLGPLLRPCPELMLQAGGAALTALASLPGLDPALLEVIEASLPPHRHIDLDTGIAALAARLAGHRLAASTDPAEHARIHHNLGVRLHDAGLRTQALAAAETATSLGRQLIRTDRDAYLPGLAGSLSNHALRLAETGRRAEAVPVSEQAVQLYQELAGLNRDAYLPGLAMSLSNHANLLAETGRRAEAVPVSEQAVQLYQELAGLNRDAYLPDCIRGLAVFGHVLIENAQVREAIAPLIEALGLGQELPEHEQGVAAAVAQLLRGAYAAQPATVAEEFHALTHLDIPAWMTGQPAPQE
jgi:tetratricopeptide (TPR) repeat protein